jgi:hypothetical protein
MTVQPAQNQYKTTYTPTPTSGTTTYTINTIGGGGGSGSILTNSGWSVAPSTTINTAILSIKPNDNGDAIIETNKGKIYLDDFYKEVCDRMCILFEDKKLHEKHPTLKDAYEKYIQVKKDTSIKIDPQLREAYDTYRSLLAVLAE